MALGRLQLFLFCRSHATLTQQSSTTTLREAIASTPSLKSSLNSAYRTPRRTNHHLRKSPNLTKAVGEVKNSKQHSTSTSLHSKQEHPIFKFKPVDETMDNKPTRRDSFNVVFDKNSQWRRNLSTLEPELFEKLGKGQAPQILWIGCADSRCPETTILGLQPGDIFCHRNIANVLISTDLNSLSVIQYAVQYLEVKHIIICGHTSCGGVAAALDNKKLGLIDTWLQPLRLLRQQNIKMLESLSPKDAALKLVDLNVRRSVSVLLENPVVIDAMIERGMKVHGVIYEVGTGELNELDITEDDEIVAERKKAFKIESKAA